MDVAYVVGPFAPQVSPFFGGYGRTLPPFPLSVGFESDGMTTSFSDHVRLFRGCVVVARARHQIRPSPTSGSSTSRR